MLSCVYYIVSIAHSVTSSFVKCASTLTHLHSLHSCTSLINDSLDLLSVSSDLLSGSFRKKSTESTAINASLYIIIQIVKSDSTGSQDRHERDRSLEYRYHLWTIEVRDRECFDKCSTVLKTGNSLSYTCAARCIWDLITVANDGNFFAQVRSDDELCTSQDCMSCGLSIQNSTSTRPARLVRKACSSRPLCFNTWQMTDTRIPTAAILKMRFTLIVPPFSVKVTG